MDQGSTLVTDESRLRLLEELRPVPEPLSLVGVLANAGPNEGVVPPSSSYLSLVTARSEAHGGVAARRTSR
jgi:hypothetical protein